MTDGGVIVRGLIGDVNSDRWVNAVDRSFVVGAWTSPAGFSCPTDVDNSGATNAVDRSFVVGAWTGVGTNCAPDPTLLLGGEGGGEPMVAGAGSEDSPLGANQSDGGAIGQPALGPWATLESSVVLDVRPVGGGDPVTSLTTGYTYEIKYSGAAYPVQGYSLSVSGTCDSECVVAAGPAFAGTWSGTGLFQDVPLDGGVFVLDDAAGASADVVEAAGLCTITPQSAGELAIDLRTYFSDSEAATVYEMVGQATVIISTP